MLEAWLRFSPVRPSLRPGFVFLPTSLTACVSRCTGGDTRYHIPFDFDELDYSTTRLQASVVVVVPTVQVALAITTAVGLERSRRELLVYENILFRDHTLFAMENSS